MSGTPVSYPTTIADRAAGLNWSGYMQRWAARSATIAGFDYTGLGTQRRLYVPLATAALAGAMSAAQFTKLATLQVPVSRLGYGPATDHLNGAALTANVAADVIANQNFTVASTASIVLFLVRAEVFVNAVATFEFTVCAVVNSGGTPITVDLDGGGAGAGGFAMAGSGAFILGPTLPAGTNTIKIQVISSVNATAYCRGSTQPRFEGVEIQIWELNP